MANLIDIKIKLDPEDRELLRNVGLALEKQKSSEHAQGLFDAAHWCESHAGDATLDRTGVERATLLRAGKALRELAERERARA